METCPDHVHIIDRLANIEKAMIEVHLALIGDLEKQGFIRDTKDRIDKIENRQSMLLKLGGWAAGIFGAGFAFVFGEFLLQFLRHK